MAKKTASKSESKEVEPYNNWLCMDCKTEPMSHPEMMGHLKEKHGCETKGLKGNKSMIMHMDGDTWFAWQYAWTVEGPSGAINLQQHTLNRRSQDDPMRYV